MQIFIYHLLIAIAYTSTQIVIYVLLLYESTRNRCESNLAQIKLHVEKSLRDGRRYIFEKLTQHSTFQWSASLKYETETGAPVVYAARYCDRNCTCTLYSNILQRVRYIIYRFRIQNIGRVFLYPN